MQSPYTTPHGSGFVTLAAHLLAEHPEDLDARGGSGVTPLHGAVINGHYDVSSLSIEHIRNPDIRGLWLQTPLLRIVLYNKVRRGDLEIGKRLLDCGTDVNAQDDEGWTPLYLAAWSGRLDFTQMLRRAQVASTQYGETPLYKASEQGHVDVVRLLLEHGADPNISDKFGKTPSDMASGHEIVQLLSEFGAKPKA